jgi:hypothetical protein
MSNPIGVIRKQAGRIHEELWLIAVNEYGLVRTPETAARIESACLDYASSGGTSAPGDIEIGLALAFFAVHCVEKEEKLEDALEMLAVAAESLGCVRVFSTLGELAPYSSKIKSAGLLSVMGSIMAKGRHAENYAMTEYVVKYWRENIDPKLSAQKAASEIDRAKVVLLSHKKIAEIISAQRTKEGLRKK